MKRLNNLEKTKLGHIIKFYRNNYFHSDIENKDDFKQVNFCHDICSQSRLSRIEKGETIKDNDVYNKLIKKLNLDYEVNKDISNNFETLFSVILKSRNNHNLIINYNEIFKRVNHLQNISRKNIINLHYTFALELILHYLNDNYVEVDSLLEYVENTIEIFEDKFRSIILQYLGLYYVKIGEYTKAEKYLLLAIEINNLNHIENPSTLLDISDLYIKKRDMLHSIIYLRKALKEYIEVDNQYNIVKVYIMLGKTYMFSKYYDDSLRYFERALKLSEEYEFMDFVGECNYLIVLNLYFFGDKKIFNNLYSKYINSIDKGTVYFKCIELLFNEDYIDQETIKENIFYDTLMKFRHMDETNLLVYIRDNMNMLLKELTIEEEAIIRQLIKTLFIKHKKYKFLVTYNIY